MFIYLITNKINGKQYVGQTTKDVNKRICQHLRDKTYIGRALRQYGIESFDISVIDSATTIAILNEKEKYWISFYGCRGPDGYNLTDGGEGGFGHIVSEESRQKLSKAMKGKQLRLGCLLSEESKAKMRLAHIGQVGIPHTEEFKTKMIGNKYAQANKGRPLSEEHKAKIGKANRNISDETRRKLSEAKKGKKYTLGLKHSEETKHKMSLAQMGNKKGIGNKNVLGNKFWLGRKHTIESRIKMSTTKKGNPGHPHTEEFKLMMVGNKKGVRRSSNINEQPYDSNNTISQL